MATGDTGCEEKDHGKRAGLSGGEPQGVWRCEDGAIIYAQACGGQGR